MFVAADRLIRRLRAASSGEQGASLILVVAYMAMAFIIAAVVAAACLFAIQQNVEAEAGVQAIAAAEAGRDAVVSAFEIAPESCPSTGQYTDDPTDSTDPRFTVTIHPTASTAEPASASGIPQRCPADSDKWVVLHSTGTAADGSTSVIDAVYPWQRYRIEVAGGALGYMDTSYNATFSSISGDTVIKHGDFACTGGTVFKGNVFVLDGDVSVAVDLARLTGEPSCEITGDLFVSGDIVTGDPSWILVWFYARLKVGGQIKVLGNIDATGRIEAGTDAAKPVKDIVAGGTILVDHSQGSVTAANGGSIKAVSDIKVTRGTISASGNLATNANLIVDGVREGLTNVAGVATGGAVSVRGAISGNNLSSVISNSGMAVGVSISGAGAREAKAGDIQVAGNITNTGAVTASANVIANGPIDGTGAVKATNGNIWSGAAISGGTRTAGGSVLARTDISASTVTATNGDVQAAAITGGNISAKNAVTASGNLSTSGTITTTSGNIAAGGTITGGARTAGGSVQAVRDISAGAITAGGDIRTNAAITGSANRIANGAISAGTGISSTGNIEVRANTGGITSGGDIVLTGATSKLIAGANATTPTGAISAAGRVESSGQTVAVDLLARAAIKVDRACLISRDVHAGTTLNFDDVVTGQNASWNSPTCAVGRNLFAGSASAAAGQSTLGSYSGSGSNRTYPNTRLSLANGGQIRVPAGWTPAANTRYMPATGNMPGTAGAVGPNPGIPTVPAAPTFTAPATPVAPTLVAPSPFTVVLNEDTTDPTWETFDDLQLRTTWVDLGTYTSWEGYTPVLLPAGTCSGTWFNPGGNITRLLSNAGPVTVNGVVVPAGPVVIDATRCTNTVSMAWSTFNLARDAVILVNKASFTLAAFGQSGATTEHPRQLFVVQVDPDNGKYRPAWGGDPEPIPHCAGRAKINVSGSGWVGWNSLVNVMVYSPCGIEGTIGSVWRGHIYVHNDTVQKEILANLTCAPMLIPGVVDLPCDINEVSTLGSMRVNAYRFGDRVAQTEY